MYFFIDESAKETPGKNYKVKMERYMINEVSWLWWSRGNYHNRGTISLITSDTTAILLHSLSFLGAGGWFQSTSHQNLKPEIHKARRPECWDWTKPLSSPATSFWEERCPKLSIHPWLWPSSGSCTETSLRLMLSCSERASSYKIPS